MFVKHFIIVVSKSTICLVRTPFKQSFELERASATVSFRGGGGGGDMGEKEFAAETFQQCFRNQSSERHCGQ